MVTNMHIADCYQKAIDYIYSFADYETQPGARAAANFDLRRMELLLARLGDPHRAMQTVHIAGTKGKGSTAAMVASVLTTGGLKTGLYTSPHLIDLRERIRLGGRLISRTDLVRLTALFRPDVVAINEAARYGKLTTFELLTALGFKYFADKDADWQVVEVGLGGRLDATNVVLPNVCAISTIGLDHVEVLGDTVEKIAAEKAGIIKDGVPVVSALQSPEVREVITDVCKERHCRFIEVGRDVVYEATKTSSRQQLCEVKGRLGSYVLKLPLLGEFQQANAALAIGVLEVLIEQGCQLCSSDIVTGINRVRWPGRFQIVRQHPLVVVDGAHNSAAAAELRKALEIYTRKNGSKILVVGMSADKDYSGLVELLAPLFDTIIATRANHPRALNTMTLTESCRSYACDVRTAPSVPEALDLAVRLAEDNGFICASGSLFVVGEALKWAGLPSY